MKPKRQQSSKVSQTLPQYPRPTSSPSLNSKPLPRLQRAALTMDFQRNQKDRREQNVT